MNQIHEFPVNISLSEKESFALALHMAIMRKSIRNIIKKKYKTEKKEFLASYDYVLNETQLLLENYNTDTGTCTLEVDLMQLTILNEFLKVYLNKLNEEFEGNWDKVSKEDKENIMELEQILDQCSKLMEQHAAALT